MKIKKIKILLYDVESFPNLAYIWGKYEQNAIGDFVKERMVVCFSWKFLGEKSVHHLALPMFKGYNKSRPNNKALVKQLHKLISSADIVVAHNVDKFDDKMSNTDFIKNGLLPPPPHRTIDTLKVARKYFAFNSNKLDDLGQALGLGRKVRTGGFSLWVGCMEGKKTAWRRMKFYNNGDVVLLEKILLREAPWMTDYPDLRGGGNECVVCAGADFQSRGVYRTRISVGTRYQCKGCGHWTKRIK